MYTYRILPPTTEINKIVSLDIPLYGIDITVPELAQHLAGNLSPQGGSTIETAMVADLPPAKARLVVAEDKLSLDTLGAMAVLALRREAHQHKANRRAGRPRIQENPTEFGCAVSGISTSAKVVRMGWPGRRPLPTLEALWPVASAAAGEITDFPEDIPQLAAMMEMVKDDRVTLSSRVKGVIEYLLNNEVPEPYLAKVTNKREQIATLLAKEMVKIVTSNDRIAVVESVYTMGTELGFYRAPVVVMLNPNYRLDRPFKRFYVCAHAQYLDLPAALAELSAMEPGGWGGSSTSLKSSDAKESKLAISDVVEVVNKHLRIN